MDVPTRLGTGGGTQLVYVVVQRHQLEVLINSGLYSRCGRLVFTSHVVLKASQLAVESAARPFLFTPPRTRLASRYQNPVARRPGQF